MPKVKEIRDYFEAQIPSYMKLDFDNVGLLVGITEAEVSRVLVALDITGETIEEAQDIGAELILSHHPLFFDLKRVVDDDDRGRKIVALLTSGISAICLHTNLDTAQGGVNDALMAALGVHVTGLLAETGHHPNGQPYGISRVGELPAPLSMREFLAQTKAALRANGLRYYDAGKPVKRIGCCGGSGGGDLPAAVAAGCDTYVTADIKYDVFLAAKECGINLIDGDHFCTENVVVPVLAGLLRQAFPQLDVRISGRHGQTAQFF